jgi:hypothetical protein
MLVASSRTRAHEDDAVGEVVHGKGQRRFRVRVYTESGDRYIQLYLDHDRDRTERRVAVVRITGSSSTG